MYSLKTLTQALLLASIATSSLATLAPDRDGAHEARAAVAPPAGLSKEAAEFIIKSALAGRRVKRNTPTTRDLDARTVELPKISPEIIDLLKTSAVGGLVGGATGATIKGITGLFEDNNGNQARGLGALSDDDLRLLSILSRRVIEELD